MVVDPLEEKGYSTKCLPLEESNAQLLKGKILDQSRYTSF